MTDQLVKVAVEQCIEIAQKHDADQEFDRGCRCGHKYDEHDHSYDDAEPCFQKGCECAEFRPHDIASRIRERFAMEPA